MFIQCQVQDARIVALRKEPAARNPRPAAKPLERARRIAHINARIAFIVSG
jgi:hypothetical protein